MSNWRLPRPHVPLPPQFGHAARVALAATLLVGVVYAGCVTILDRAVTARLVASVDARLREHLADGVPGRRGPAAPAGQTATTGPGPTTMRTSTRRRCSCGGPGPGTARSG